MLYRPEIDGLRSVAVLPVILFHAGVSLFSGGFVGVDVFFVISGYLITAIILEDLYCGKFSILNFYQRRARRILPALFLVLSFSIPQALKWMDPFSYKEFSQSLVSVATFCSNIFFYFKTGYFNTAAASKPLLHTWSLAVEEQFYIVFPLLLVFLFKNSKRRGVLLAPVLGGIFVLSFVASELLTRSNPSSAFYLIHSRAWELLLGSFSAFLLKEGPLKRPNMISHSILSLAGLAMILFSVFRFNENTPFPGVAALLPTLGTFLIIVFAAAGTMTSRLLSHRVAVGIGLISYSAYLWHQPLLAFFAVITFRRPNSVEVGAIVAVTLLLAWASYRFIETPFRKKRLLKTRKSVFAVAAGCLCGLLGFGLLGHAYNGFPARNPGFLRLAQNYGLSESCSGAPIEDARCQTKSDPKVILWGDSHAMHLGLAAEKLFAEAGIRQTTLSSCPPVPNYKGASRKTAISCFDYNAQVQEWLVKQSHPQDDLIILSSVVDFSSSEFKDDFVKNVTLLKRKGYSVLLVSSTPFFWEARDCLLRTTRIRGDFGKCVFPEKDAVNLQYFSNMQQLADGLGIRYVSLLDLFCDGRQCRVSRDGKLLMRDEGHLSLEGQDMVYQYVLGRISRFDDLRKWISTQPGAGG